MPKLSLLPSLQDPSSILSYLRENFNRIEDAFNHLSGGGDTHDHMGLGTNSTVISGLLDTILPLALADGSWAGGDTAESHGPDSIALGRAALAGADGITIDGIAIGHYAAAIGERSIVIGASGQDSLAQDGYDILIGAYADASSGSGFNIIIGQDGAITEGSEDIIIGDSAAARGAGANNIVLGYEAKINPAGGGSDGGVNNIVIGRRAESRGHYTVDTIVIGYLAVADAGTTPTGINDTPNGIIIGENAYGIGDSVTVVGGQAQALDSYSVVLGESAIVYTPWGIAIGEVADVNTSIRGDSKGGIAIGRDSNVADDFAVALGQHSYTTHANQIQLGENKNVVSLPGGLECAPLWINTNYTFSDGPDHDSESWDGTGANLSPQQLLVLMVDASGGAKTITLPGILGVGGANANLVGRFIMVMKVDASANAVTVQGAGADTIQGAASINLAAQYSKCFLLSAKVSAAPTYTWTRWI